MAQKLLEEKYYHELKDLPRPKYPFPDLVNPLIEDRVLEANKWIDVDCPFESEQAREKHKRHRFTDLLCRCFPWMTEDELRPIDRYTVFLAILDDFMDGCTEDEVARATERTFAILTGKDGYTMEPEPGYYHQMYAMRQDMLEAGVPVFQYTDYVNSIRDLMREYGTEKQYNAQNKPASFEIFEKVRQETSGGKVYAKYLGMHKKYCAMPEEVLHHPQILRMHDLVGILIGYHNDFASLFKELSRPGDVSNLIIVVRDEQGLGLKEAWHKALEIHDKDLAEFIALQDQLPDFGEWQSLAEEYVRDLGIVIQGCWGWHEKNSGRYVPGSYVEPEYEGEGLDRKATPLSI